VVVSLITQNTSLVSVLGEVKAPSRLTANAAGERVLDLIARAGGLTGLHPGDTIYVYREPQVFLAFGAFVVGGSFGGQAQFPFDMWKISMAQAVAKAGGLLDAQAEPAGVYVYRREPRELAERLGVDCSKYVGPLVPVVYNADFRDPAGFFLASKFEMRDKDVLFAANAATVDTAKFLQFVRLVIGTANDTIVSANNAQILKINSRQ
jgi:polysaccharide export outer membrane protein